MVQSRKRRACYNIKSMAYIVPLAIQNSAALLISAQDLSREPIVQSSATEDQESLGKLGERERDVGRGDDGGEY